MDGPQSPSFPQAPNCLSSQLFSEHRGNMMFIPRRLPSCHFPKAAFAWKEARWPEGILAMRACPAVCCGAEQLPPDAKVLGYLCMFSGASCSALSAIWLRTAADFSGRTFCNNFSKARARAAKLYFARLKGSFERLLRAHSFILVLEPELRIASCAQRLRFQLTWRAVA